MREDLHQQLVAHGASDDEIARAESGGWLPLLALDRLLMPGEPAHDVDDVARAVGLDPDVLRRLWRAVGFPDVPAGMRVFTDGDIAAARTALHGTFAQSHDENALLRDVRTISAAMARVAGVVSDYLAERIESARRAGVDDEAIALELFSGFDMEELRSLIDYELRLQLRASIWRRVAIDATPDMVIGVAFADLTGYTELSGRLDAAALSTLVTTWESLAYDTITAHGARLVKTIGDEVMFVGLPVQVADAALALIAVMATHGLPPLHVGLAAGPVIPRGGDFYGPVVNLASRLTTVADNGEIVAPRTIRDELPANLFTTTDRGRHVLRGIGEVETVMVSRAG